MGGLKQYDDEFLCIVEDTNRHLFYRFIRSFTILTKQVTRMLSNIQTGIDCRTTASVLMKFMLNQKPSVFNIFLLFFILYIDFHSVNNYVHQACCRLPQAKSFIPSTTLAKDSKTLVGFLLASILPRP